MNGTRQMIPGGRAQILHDWAGRVALLFVVADDGNPTGERAWAIFVFDDEASYSADEILANLNAHLAAAWGRVVQLRGLRPAQRAQAENISARLQSWMHQTQALAKDLDQEPDPIRDDRLTRAMREAATAAARRLDVMLLERCVHPPTDPLAVAECLWTAMHWARDQVRIAIGDWTTSVMSRNESIANLLDGAAAADVEIPEAEAWTRAILRFPSRVRAGEPDHVVADVLALARQAPPSVG